MDKNEVHAWYRKINSQGKLHHLLMILDKCSDICPCGTISSTWCILPLLTLDHFWHSANAVDVTNSFRACLLLWGMVASIPFPGTGRCVILFSPGPKNSLLGSPPRARAVGLAMVISPQSQPPNLI